MALVHYFVHGRGRGHASRTRDAVPALRSAGHEVRVFAGGQAREALADAVAVEPRAVVPRGVRGLRTWAALYRGDLARARVTRRPDVIVSDGDLPALAAARRLGVRRVAVGHDLVFATAALPPGLPRWALLREQPNARLAGALAEETVAVHFLPTGTSRVRAHVARIAGVDLEGPVSDEGFFVAYFRDPNADPVLDALADSGAEVVCFGTETRPRPGIDVRPFDRANLVAHLRRCRGVVGSSGSNLLAECVLLGKPVLAVHREDEAEQALNAAMVEAAGVGTRAPLGRLRPPEVARFADRARRGGFARVDLRARLDPLPEVLVHRLGALVGAG